MHKTLAELQFNMQVYLTSWQAMCRASAAIAKILAKLAKGSDGAGGSNDGGKDKQEVSPLLDMVNEGLKIVTWAMHTVARCYVLDGASSGRKGEDVQSHRRDERYRTWYSPEKISVRLPKVLESVRGEEASNTNVRQLVMTFRYGTFCAVHICVVPLAHQGHFGQVSILAKFCLRCVLFPAVSPALN